MALNAGHRVSGRPNVSIPPGARPPEMHSPASAWASYGLHPDRTSYVAPVPFSPQRPSFINPTSPRRSSFHDSPSEWSFQDPQGSRQSYQRNETLQPGPSFNQHRHSRSDLGPQLHLGRQESFSSLAGGQDWEVTSPTPASLSNELSHSSLSAEESLYRFQEGTLPEPDNQWHRLVPQEARDSLPGKEVQRQSVIFELINSEKEYVSDLEILQDVYINPLVNANPPIMPQDYLLAFTKEVFWNLNEILHVHQRLLAALFARQRDQHPLVQSIADIVLDTALKFQPPYESYIKHYPLAEARHRRELKRNPRYQHYIQECSQNPRTRKRDLITFISRPVTRLPRLRLILEQIQKLTEPDHPDLETMPIILDLLGDFIRSTQPGIEAAESKVKFWSLSESLVFRPGEIIDMDLYSDNRTLVYQGPLARRQRSETDWHGWHDMEVALLDNYLLITRKEKRESGFKYIVASRPIPLEYLRLGAFDAPQESRKEKSSEGGGILDAVKFHYIPVYPFTVYHASAKSSRRYTLYAASERLREKWRNCLVDAIGVRQAYNDANKHFAANPLNDGHFRTRTVQVPPDAPGPFLGKVNSAASFMSGGRSFIAIGTSGGVHVHARGTNEIRGALRLPFTSSISALQGFNKLILQCEQGVLSYSLDLLARVALQNASPSLLEASMENISQRDESVQFFRTGIVANRTIVVYASRTFRQSNINALEVVHPQNVMNAQRQYTMAPSFRSFGSPFYVPKDAYDVTMLRKTIAIATEKGLSIVDPTHLANGQVTTVPDFSKSNGDRAVAHLKARCEDGKVLGMLQSGDRELLVIYDDFGCYITKHGQPTRTAGLIRWETPAVAYAFRKPYVILFSPDFVEVRDVSTGRLVQVIEGRDFRLIESGPQSGPILIAMRGSIDDRQGLSDALLEMVETAPLYVGSGNGDDVLWEDWV
ncbi:hypothetical protein SISNIDRAFT_460111 [Sistotremastrum niveocremeum HHB9708]|uniref:Rho1 guanine nucleotide exchange factor 1 n=2 Tax=Sistotremastraceae TaxID=3402574 RepID=A0A164NUR0_9AGAM|nr:hypothetical protein SISNIDRAFT_460111 [Sistotremastrum niveocremeum HHB9708]KZT40514.1 hypothetical protein SISSUDRAFT_1044238 [Sistotremastrum suecicum HHB10207 ss-3]